MPRRRIGQEELFAGQDRGSSLDGLLVLIDWSEVAVRLEAIHASAKGEASWPPLAMFRALLLSIWYDLSDVKLAEALDDRASFRRFCGFSRSEATPERTAFVRFRKALLAHGLEMVLFEAVMAQLKARAVRVKTGTIVDTSVVASASERDGEAAWSGHRSRKAIHGYKAHVGADADSAQAVQTRYNIGRVIAAPVSTSGIDPVKVIAAAAGSFVNAAMRPSMTVGVGWGRTLYNSLPFIAGRTLDDFRVVSLLGGIAAARRFNPAEFAWQFAELFQGEGYLIPAPAIVDSPETRHALLEHCGLAEIFQMADHLDPVLLSVGSMSGLTTSYRMGHVSEAERRALVAAGAVGDILYNFIDEEGRPVDHPVNSRIMSVDLARLRKTPERVLVSGGAEKLPVLRGAIKALSPTVLITDELTAAALAAGGGAS